jgi:RNA polymerase sigma factor (sigma-70 family)
LTSPPAPESGPTEADIREIYERYGPIIYRRCLSILGTEEAAQDALQETLARVIRSWDSFRGESSPLTWMYRSSTNWCLNQIRNRKGRMEKLHVHRQDIIGAGVASPDTTAGETADVVRNLLTDADEETRQIVLYLYFDDLTQQECASLVSLSVPTVRKRLNEFLKRSRRVLEASPVPVALGLVLLAWWVI